jgi:hypothetical protein
VKAARLTRLSHITTHRLYTLPRGRIVGLACTEAHAYSNEIEDDELVAGDAGGNRL